MCLYVVMPEGGGSGGALWGGRRTVHQGGQGPLVVRVGEEDELLVDEVVVGQVPGLRSVQVLLEEESAVSSPNTKLSLVPEPLFIWSVITLV